jgi:hypothetical protein
MTKDSVNNNLNGERNISICFILPAIHRLQFVSCNFVNRL